MEIRCPSCGETKVRTKERRYFRWSPAIILLGFIGGAIGGVFYALGLKSKFRCGRCNQTFLSHTTVSLVFSILCVVVYVAIAGAVGYGIWSASTSR